MLQKNKFAFAVADVMAAVGALCAGLVAIAPELAAKLAGSIMHLVNIDPAMKITWGGFFLGLVQVWVYSFILAYVFAWIHNKYSEQAR
ncbi:MAG: hypothetical protein HUT38_03730 [Candidatus Paceibacter sp.]|nr:hypothetical protein [Candidatus Paceibacter sp.]